MVREAKKIYIRNNLEIHQLNPKEFWRTLNSIMKPEQNDSVDVEFHDKANDRKIPVDETCDFLNGFFANVGNRKYPAQGVFSDTVLDCAKLEIGQVNVREVKKTSQ